MKTAMMGALVAVTILVTAAFGPAYADDLATNAPDGPGMMQAVGDGEYAVCQGIGICEPGMIRAVGDSEYAVELKALGSPTEGEPLGLMLRFMDAEGGMAEHVNYDVRVTQDGKDVYTSASTSHAHEGHGSFSTRPLASDSSLDVLVIFQGVGLPDEEKTGPVGKMVVFAEVPAAKKDAVQAADADRAVSFSVRFYDGPFRTEITIDTYSGFGQLHKATDDTSLNFNRGADTTPSLHLTSVPSLDKMPIYEVIARYLSSATDKHFDVDLDMITGSGQVLQTLVYSNCVFNDYWAYVDTDKDSYRLSGGTGPEIRDVTVISCSGFGLDTPTA